MAGRSGSLGCRLDFGLDLPAFEASSRRPSSRSPASHLALDVGGDGLPAGVLLHGPMLLRVRVALTDLTAPRGSTAERGRVRRGWRGPALPFYPAPAAGLHVLGAAPPLPRGSPSSTGGSSVRVSEELDNLAVALDRDALGDEVSPGSSPARLWPRRTRSRCGEHSLRLKFGAVDSVMRLAVRLRVVLLFVGVLQEFGRDALGVGTRGHVVVEAVVAARRRLGRQGLVEIPTTWSRSSS